jgi:hypothetical protein
VEMLGVDRAFTTDDVREIDRALDLDEEELADAAARG